MKKLVIIFNILLTLLLINSCKQKTKFTPEDDPCSIGPYFQEIEEFTYKDHQYIMFITIDDECSIVHDPECDLCKVERGEE